MLQTFLTLYLLTIFLSPLPVLGLIGALCLPAISCYGAGILPLCTFCAYAIPFLFARSGYRFSVVLATTILMASLPIPFLGDASGLESQGRFSVLGVFWLIITVPAIPGILIACICRRK
jgi:hypothetical protein